MKMTSDSLNSSNRPEKSEKEKQPSKFASWLKEYAVITFGVFLVSVGVYFFKFPNNISTGGITGLAIVLEQLFPILTKANFVTIFNFFFLILGFVVLGRDFGVKTAYGSILLSLFLEGYDFIFKLCHVSTSVLPLTNEPVLELFFAVAFPAIGAAVLFCHHGSTGGTDTVAMIIRKYTNIDSGRALMMVDFVLVLFLFYNFQTHEINWELGMLSVAGTTIKCFVVDIVIESINQSKYFLVITTHPKEVEQYIIELGRSATTWECQGAYTHGTEYALITVMTRYQGFQLRNKIKKIDPHSFVIVTNTSDIMGKGFKQV